MQEYILKNNIKLIYQKTNTELTSICIGIDAGAVKEEKLMGAAHATEHMVYKGTRKRSENQINEELNEIFGFQNAMTNFPYVIYYGTLLNNDFERGIELFSDILINPSFTREGFKKEMEIIKQELEEWDEEPEQYCEDRLFLNAFEERRLKYPIIGRKSDLEKMKIEDIIDFYNHNYFPENTSIVVISSLEFSMVEKAVNKYFSQWEKQNENYKERKEKIEYEKLKEGIFKNSKDGMKVCRIEMVCPINQLNIKEIGMLRLFDEYFGSGVNSLLYHNLRTENNLVYDVITTVQNESYMKMYKITFGTSRENIERAIKSIESCIRNLSVDLIVDMDMAEKLHKSLKRKKLFNEEKSIVLAKELATYSVMFGKAEEYEEQYAEDKSITIKEIIELGKNVLKNLTTQIIQ